ncbi:MAG: T9SS type A sorting domain-containing protein [Bacteroidales bacterium]|nr:T9SS type A sorting domain-containing protein [Bacteroidales bacterium]
MKNFLSLFLFLFISLGIYSQANWAWVNNAGGSGDDRANAICRDNSGYSYVTGSFNGTVSFGSGNSLISSGGSDMFIAKYNSDGNFEWAKKAGSNANDKGLDIKIDKQGNILVLGWHAANAFFGTTQLNTADGAQSFIAKYSNIGELIWVKKLGGHARTFSVDAANNIFIAASFSGTVKVENTSLTSTGNDDIWFGKFTSAGNLSWVRRIHGNNGDETPISLAISHDNKILLNGRISGICNFEGGGLISNSGGASNQDMFLVKYDTSGAFIWSRQFSASISEESASNSLIVNSSGEILISGIFSGNLNFGSLMVASSGSTDAFVTKLSSDANTAIWLNKMGTPSADGSFGIGVDAADNVFITGFYGDSLTINNVFIPKPSVSGSFIAKYNNSGVFQWIKPVVGSGAAFGSGIHVNIDGSAQICGRFTTNANFHGKTINGNGNFDMFVAKSEIVYTPPLKANFSASSTTINQGSSVLFTDLSVGNPNLWIWTIQGVTPSVYDVLNPNVTYSIPGTYDVKLSISNAYGETSEILKPGYITVEAYVDPCNAIKFDGTDDYVDFGNRSVLRFQSGFTVEAWINPHEERGYPISFMNLTSTVKNGYGFGYENGKLRFLIQPLSMPVADWSDLPGAVLPLNEWSHVAATYDGKAVKFYLNGNLVESKTISTNVQSITWSTLPTGLYAGRYMATNPAEASYFKGVIDEIRLWKTVRTPSEITNNYMTKMIGTETNLAAYWNFNEGEGTIAHDLGPNNYNGNLKNGPVWVPSSTSCWGVGIDEVSDNESIHVYPNPFSDEVMVENIPANSMLTLLDMNGKIVFQSFENNSTTIINCGFLNNGLYFLNIQSENTIINRKLIKINR